MKSKYSNAALFSPRWFSAAGCASVSVPVCLCELESPPVLFALIKQQRYGTLDTLNQSPSHYWNIRLLQSQEPQCLNHVYRMSKLDAFRCVPYLRVTLAGATISSDAYLPTALSAAWQSLHNTLSELPRCQRSHRSLSCRRDVWTCQRQLSWQRGRTQTVVTGIQGVGRSLFCLRSKLTTYGYSIKKLIFIVFIKSLKQKAFALNTFSNL